MKKLLPLAIPVVALFGIAIILVTGRADAQVVEKVCDKTGITIKFKSGYVFRKNADEIKASVARPAPVDLLDDLKANAAKEIDLNRLVIKVNADTGECVEMTIGG